MRAWKRGAMSGLVAVVLGAGLSAVTTVGTAGAATATCPLSALKKATKPVEITVWHAMPRSNEETLRIFSTDLPEALERSENQLQVLLRDQCAVRCYSLFHAADS